MVGGGGEVVPYIKFGFKIDIFKIINLFLFFGQMFVERYTYYESFWIVIKVKIPKYSGSHVIQVIVSLIKSGNKVIDLNLKQT